MHSTQASPSPPTPFFPPMWCAYVRKLREHFPVTRTHMAHGAHKHTFGTSSRSWSIQNTYIHSKQAVGFGVIVRKFAWNNIQYITEWFHSTDTRRRDPVVWKTNRNWTEKEKRCMIKLNIYWNNNWVVSQELQGVPAGERYMAFLKK